MNVTLKRPLGPLDWMQVYQLYKQVFPASERKPFAIILKMTRRNKTDVWQLLADGRFTGFATTINGDGVVMLDYLAVPQTARNGGIGTEALRLLQDRYAGQGFFVEIESPFEEGPDQIDRQRRRAFYRHCGLEPLKVMAMVFGVKMELLGRGCDMDFDRYQAFYRDNYSPFAAEHLVKASHPENI